MAVLDYDAILNSNQKKRLLIGYDNLKQNFNESEAASYSELYKDQPLSFILENSRNIFCEPYFGFDFYKNVIMESEKYCLFTELENQKEIVADYVTEHGEEMEDFQKEMYTELLDLITEKCNELHNTIVVAGCSLEESKNDEWVRDLSDSLYEGAKNDYENIDKINTLMESVSDEKAYFCYVPYVAKATGQPMNGKMVDKFFTEYTEAELNEVDNFSNFINVAVTATKLANDAVYTEAVKSIRPRELRYVFEGVTADDIGRYIGEITTEKVADVNTFYSTPFFAVNGIYEGNLLYKMNSEENHAEKERRTLMESVLYESVRKYVDYEYSHYDDDKKEVIGYGSLFESGTTLEEAYNITSSYLVESEEESEKDGKEPKKVNAPKAESLAEKIQVKAMDIEAKASQKRAERKRKGQQIKNAAKSVSTVPMSDIKDFQNEVKSLDDMDDNRRINYMTKPGFRKKFFKKLKLALMYGTAAQVNLLYVPVVAVLRHYSKMKDRRIRNSLFHDIKTEIKICDAKIQDADANGEKDKKYELMRIRSELEKQAVRVANNSKYI